MAQQPFSVLCGTCHISQPNCPPSFAPFTDVDGTGHQIVYSTTVTLTPCNAPVVTTQPPPNAENGQTWSSGYRPTAGGTIYDAAHPPNVADAVPPLPPHCWGWQGSGDYLKTTYYDFTNTLLTILAGSGEFPYIQSLSITRDYDVHTVRKFSRRTYSYTYTDFPTTPKVFLSDNCIDLSSSDTTTHHSDVMFTASASGSSGHLIPNTGVWNCLNLATFPLICGSTGSSNVAFVREWQDSAYWDSSVATLSDTGWGGFVSRNTVTATGPPTQHRIDYVYEFGQETVTVASVIFTLTVTWVQYHCAPNSTAGQAPCDCNTDCPPCAGDNPPVKTGRCTTLCADPGASPNPITGWYIQKPDGSLVATSSTPGTWSVTQPDRCSLQVCAPCYTTGDYLGPFTVVWGTSDTCTCPGQGNQYKIFGASFSLQVDVLCGGVPPPGSGGANPFNFEDRPGIGHYHATSISGANAVYSRAYFRSPSGGWDVNNVTVATAATGKQLNDLRVGRDHRDTLHGVYSQSNTDGSAPSVYYTFSDDDGTTWSSGSVAIAGGKHPTVAVGSPENPFRPVVIAAYSGGSITAQIKYAGDTVFGTPFTFKDASGANLAVADDTFHLQQAPEGSSLWILHCATSTGTAHYRSADDCATWEPIT